MCGMVLQQYAYRVSEVHELKLEFWPSTGMYTLPHPNHTSGFWCRTIFSYVVAMVGGTPRFTIWN